MPRKTGVFPTALDKSPRSTNLLPDDAGGRVANGRAGKDDGVPLGALVEGLDAGVERRVDLPWKRTF